MERRNKMILVVLFILYVVLASSGLVLFKLGSGNANIQFNLFGLNLAFSWKMLLGIACYGCSFLLWLYIVSRMNLTFAMPLSVALVNTLVIVESCLVLKEKITPIQGIGIFIVILGVAIMTGGKKA